MNNYRSIAKGFTIMLMLAGLVMAGCATTPKPAVLLVEGITTTVAVVNVDQAKQTVTLKMKDGSIKVYAIKGDVKNFDKIKAGDVLRATVLESIAIGVRKTKDQAGIKEGESVGVAPKNQKPGIIVTDTLELDSKIVSLDLDKGSITLKAPDGSVNTYKIDVNNPDFKKIKAGEDVTVVLTKSIILDFEASGSTGK